MSRSDPQGLLPLKPLVLEILLFLNEGELHGYRIAKESESRLPGKRILPGNLYRTLNRMARDSLIERQRRRVDDERRRSFRIAPFGREVLRAEVEHLRAIVLTARTQKLLSR